MTSQNDVRPNDEQIAKGVAVARQAARQFIAFYGPLAPLRRGELMADDLFDSIITKIDEALGGTSRATLDSELDALTDVGLGDRSDVSMTADLYACDFAVAGYLLGVIIGQLGTPTVGEDV